MKTKVCTKCREVLPLSKFWRGKGKFGLHSWCKTCLNRAGKNWHQKNVEHTKHVWRRWKYGIEPEDYAALLEEQKGACKICGGPEIRIFRGKVTALIVDHDHETGEVRELLCYLCNSMIGYAKHSPDRLRKAAEYLVRHRKNS